jgi:DHA1 family bicyclomycin/chloramphenicol resistance-like MFS transporter
VVSATYIALFYNTPNPDVRVLLLFFAMQFFSIGFLLVIYVLWLWSLWDTLRDAVISTIMAVPISIFIGRFIADRALPLFVGSICATLSVGLLIYLKIDEKRVNTSENRI